MMNILHRLFTFRAFLLIGVPTLVVIVIRLLLIKCGFDISDFVSNFYTCSITLFLLNLIRFVVRTIMEKYTMSIYLNFDNPNPLEGGNINPNPNPPQNVGQPNPPQNVGQPIFYGNGFSFDGRIYTIDDPTNVRNRGFLDPITMRPFNSYQPYATNLSNAMAHAVQGAQPTQGMNPSVYDHNAIIFYEEYMRYTYPNRHPSQY